MKRVDAKPLGALIALVVVAIAVTGYILIHQRLPLPWEQAYTVKAEFPSAQAVTPGQGQQVTVAGVKVGEVSAVNLVDGRAVISMRIEKNKLRSVGVNARMLIRPKTPLQDMSIDLDPGPPSQRSIGSRVIPLAQTRSNVNVDEVLSGVDADVRSYLQIMLASFGRGFDKRGINLRHVLQASTPTVSALNGLDRTLQGRRSDLRDLVGHLRSLTGALAAQRQSIQTLVQAGSATFTTLGAEQAPLKRSLALLPGTLKRANGVLKSIVPFSNQLAGTARDLVPVASDLGPTLTRLRPFVQDAKPAVDVLRKLTPEAQPLAQDLQRSLQKLRPTTPQLAQILKTTQYALNELAYQPAAPDKGFLFWLAWFGHDVNSMLSTQDANGAVWRTVVIAACTTVVPLPGIVDSLKPLFAVPNLCPKSE
jgi:phospholipid/cholesterol/gamma-HCH transport system substrate-binding protein